MEDPWHERQLSNNIADVIRVCAVAGIPEFTLNFGQLPLIERVRKSGAGLVPYHDVEMLFPLSLEALSDIRLLALHALQLVRLFADALLHDEVAALQLL